MAKQTYYRTLIKTRKRLVVDIPKDLYRLFRGSSYRKEAATDSEGMRQLLNKVLRTEN